MVSNAGISSYFNQVISEMMATEFTASDDGGKLELNLRAMD
jgi:hypothetical protein